MARWRCDLRDHPLAVWIELEIGLADGNAAGPLPLQRQRSGLLRRQAGMRTAAGSQLQAPGREASRYFGPRKLLDPHHIGLRQHVTKSLALAR
jgi:hypothetical protein